MNQQPQTRQALYDRIRQSSKDEVILTEMIRLGFWPSSGELPNDPAEEIQRQGEIQRELSELRAENRKLNDEKALKKRLLKERLVASLQKRQETKARREQERQERAAAWKARQAQDITYLGEGVSSGLNHVECDVERLQRHNLPELGTAAAIAAAMGISVGELRWLAFSRRTSQVSHYIRFRIPKKTGGERLISAPAPRLKKAQYWIEANILQLIEIHDAAHGFCRQRSIVTNAQPHVGADIVTNLDLQDFFPSVSYRRVKGMFRALGYSEAAATIFALICTEPEVEMVELDGRTYYVAQSDRRLPQGAPTSPSITNILCHRLDRRLTGLAQEFDYAYTRYADDLTFSASGAATEQVGRLLRQVTQIVSHEGFQVHPQKTRVLRKSRQQEVTGIVVNDKLNVDRKTLKRFRATLYQIEQDGLAGKVWGHSADLMGAIEGFANYVYMVNPDKGSHFLAQIKRIKQKHRPKRHQPRKS
ncbi:RNA-directed DNA polymerase [filamentous cyanobacterium LEGE 11480]|uniref:RNA-directed DNA polymerase n=1 Tax=Romeriopsis navalis LEGE 11480 TaxID=2777977 RepID=A0A928VPY5_9CYAN|nr:reverse transcriptase domain-containing protein [Romeriopsis navalis]MBE9029949.1 RNA-directed DNA polymerase [Romeriopsis navalis LEGE 11480]